MTKHRHNKKRNTAILYETLIRELVRASAHKNKVRSNAILKILKESFNKNTLLASELELYKTLNEKMGCEKELAAKILNETKDRYSKINKKSLFKEQSSVIKKINYELGREMFENFVPTFKNYATIYQVLYGVKNPKQQVVLEESVIKEMSSASLNEKTKYKTIDKLSFKTFLNKFNEKYKDKLLKEQKQLLSLYASSFQNNDLELKIFLNEEISRLKKTIKETDLEQKEQILEILDSFAKKSIDKNVLNKILKIQQLISEILKHGN